MDEGIADDSFLQEELDAFDKIYSELLDSDRNTEEKKKMAAELRRRSRLMASHVDASPVQQRRRCPAHAQSKGSSGQSQELQPSKSCDPDSRSSAANRERDPAAEGHVTSCPECRANRNETTPSPNANLASASRTPSSSVVADLEADIEDLSFIASGQKYDTGDKLFLDLLDDLDNISGNTPSARRRKRARDLFSDWLFSQEAAIEEESPQKTKDSFSEYVEQFDADFFAAINPKPLRHRKLHARWRPKSRAFDYHSEVSAILY